MDPAAADIDENGFRNAADADAEWVAIGDSHTYGFNVSSADSWPQQAAKASGQSVYSMGVGGYGILQHRALFDQALARTPRSILLALYLVNDISDYCEFAALPYWQTQLEERGLSAARCESPEGGAAPRRPRKPPKCWQRTAIGSALDVLVLDATRPYSNPERYLWFRYGDNETVIRKGRVWKHAKQMDPESPEFVEASKASEHLLEEMIASAREAAVSFGVLLVPSKERVLAEFLVVEELDEAELTKFEEAVALETKLTQRTARFLSERGIPTADPTKCLREHLELQLYPRSHDGHPLAAGYACYAAAATEILAANAAPAAD